jgi:GTP cyclohydrolase II
MELNLHFTVFLYFLWGLMEHVEEWLIQWHIACYTFDMFGSGRDCGWWGDRREREHAKAIYLMG